MNLETTLEILRLSDKYGSLIVGTRACNRNNSLGNIVYWKKENTLYGYHHETMRQYVNKLSNVGLFKKRIKDMGYKVRVMKKVYRKTTHKRSGGLICFTKPHFINRLCNVYTINPVFQDKVRKVLKGELKLTKLIEFCKYVKNETFKFLKNKKAENLHILILEKMRTWWYQLCHVNSTWARRLKYHKSKVRKPLYFSRTA